MLVQTTHRNNIGISVSLKSTAPPQQSMTNMLHQNNSARDRTPTSLHSKSAALEEVCVHLLAGAMSEASNVLATKYPFLPINTVKRSYSIAEQVRTFERDGYIDQYSGAKLIFPGTLRLLSHILPTEFPFHPNWKMSATHSAFWEFFPTLDHIVPIARGGRNVPENLATTSQIQNCAKANWLLEELGWQRHLPGDLNDWDGLSTWFVDYLNAHPLYLQDKYIRAWHQGVVGSQLARRFASAAQAV